MNESTPVPPRRRLQELLAIPERDRTEAQWDELNELEITLASSNRDQGGQQQRVGQGGHNPGGQGKPGNKQRGKRPQQQFKRRQPKPNR